MKTGKEQRVQVPHSKEIANHAVPESCALGCEALREALTGVRTGQPLSRDRRIVLGADAVVGAEGNMCGRAIASARTTRRGRRTWHVRTFLVRESGDLQSDRRCPLWPAARVGKARSCKPMMNGLEKSDSAVVAAKPANKAGQPAAEWVEPRAAD